MRTSSAERRLTREEFERACQNRRFTDRGRQIAFAQLVERRSADEVATEFGITRARATVLARAVYSAHLESIDYPPGWITVTLTAPPEAVRKFQNETEHQLKAWRKFRGRQ
ncbi:MAG: TrfB-related DNA-binding protein [Lautropia sp.]